MIAVVINGDLASNGDRVELPGCTVTVTTGTNDTLTGLSEAAIIQTSTMKFTVWAPKALALSDDPSKDQASQPYN